MCRLLTRCTHRVCSLVWSGEKRKKIRLVSLSVDLRILKYARNVCGSVTFWEQVCRYSGERCNHFTLPEHLDQIQEGFEAHRHCVRPLQRSEQLLLSSKLQAEILKPVKQIEKFYLFQEIRISTLEFHLVPIKVNE